MVTELETRPVPYEQIEVSFARNRPVHERPRLPYSGMRVYYRREYWDQSPVLATVVRVQSLDDRSDPNLWVTVRDIFGNPIIDNGVPRMAPAVDPWPEVELLLPDGRHAITRESRLRGSPGWLPLDWRQRPVRLPAELLLISRPTLSPVNVPFAEFGG